MGINVSFFRHGVCAPGLLAPGVRPVHLALPGVGLLHLWHIQTRLHRWVRSKAHRQEATARPHFGCLCSGTFAVISIMVGSVTERIAPNSNFITNGTNGTESVDIAARDAYRVQIACALSVLTGIFQVCLYSFPVILLYFNPRLPHLRSFWVWWGLVLWSPTCRNRWFGATPQDQPVTCASRSSSTCLESLQLVSPDPCLLFMWATDNILLKYWSNCKTPLLKVMLFVFHIPIFQSWFVFATLFIL